MTAKHSVVLLQMALSGEHVVQDLKLEGESVVGRGSGDRNEAPGQWVQCSKLFRLLLGHWKLM